MQGISEKIGILIKAFASKQITERELINELLKAQNMARFLELGNGRDGDEYNISEASTIH